MIIKNNFRILRYIFTFFIAFTMLNCSKDDSVDESSANKVVKANNYESILIVSNKELSQNQYTATFGSLNVVVLKVDSNTLTFMIPADAPLGNNELTIPDLNNTKITYNVSQPTLTQTPQETVAPLFSEFETFFTNLDTPTLESGIAKNNYLQFKNYWNSTATATEKEQIALWYQTNKALIDEMFYLGNTIVSKKMNTNGKMMNSSRLRSIFGSYTHIVGRVVAIAGVGLTATALTATTVAAAPVILGIAVIGVGIKACSDGNDEILNDIREQLNIATEGLSGKLNKSKMVDNSINLISNQLQPIPFSIQSGTISQEDANSSNALLKEYFSTTSILNNTIDNVDNTIDWVNSKKATSYQPFDEVVIPANSTKETSNITPEIMQGIKFSISHPNLQLISTTLGTDGQLNLKVKVIGSPTTNPVVSTLNYSYKDEISDFSGHFDITVENPDKVIRYNLTVDGVNYSGVKKLYYGAGSYHDGDNFYHYNDNVTQYQNKSYTVFIEYAANKLISFGNIGVSSSGNSESYTTIKTTVDGRSNTYAPENQYATLSKNGSTSFTFSEIYINMGFLNGTNISQMNVSGSVIVE